MELKTAIKNKDIQISELHLSLNDKTLQLTQAEEKLARPFNSKEISRGHKYHGSTTATGT